MRPLILIGFVSAMVWTTNTAHAEQCTVSGDVTIESLDSYYCDPRSVGYCASWFESDLARTVKPLQFMVVAVVDPSYNSLGWGVTDVNGHYTVTWTAQTTCPTEAYLWLTYTRIHEQDIQSPDPRWRFQMVDMNRAVYGFLFSIPMTGPNTTFPAAGTVFFPRNIFNPFMIPATAAANVYYTTNSAINQMKTWRASIDNAFAIRGTDILKIVYDVNLSNGNSNSGIREITLDASAYNQGMGVRHELGHYVLHTLHHDAQSSVCFSYWFGWEGDGHRDDTCEWAGVAMRESLATFFGVRSITSTNTNAWSCGSDDNTNQRVCSDWARDIQSGTIPDTDRIANLPNGRFVGIGDAFASSRSHCAEVLAGDDPLGWPLSGCETCSGFDCNPCPDSNSDGICDNSILWGFRVEDDIVRFLWDLIDANDEGNEPTALPIGDLTGLIEGMPCHNDATGWNHDGDCNEGERGNEQECVPLDTVGIAVTPARGSRDAYNPRDFDDLIPGSQSGAIVVNCVDLSTD